MQKSQPRKRLTVEGQGNDGNIRSQARVRPFLFLALGGCYEPSPPQTLVENHKTANWSLQQGDEGKQRWRSGESTLLPPMWSCPGSNVCHMHMRVEFVLGSLPRVLSGYAGFSLFLKTNTFKSQFDLGTHGHVSNKLLSESTNYKLFLFTKK